MGEQDNTGNGLIDQIQNASSTTTYQNLTREEFDRIYKQTGTTIWGGASTTTDSSYQWFNSVAGPGYKYLQGQPVDPIEVKGKLTIHFFGDQAPFLQPVSQQNPEWESITSTTPGTTTPQIYYTQGDTGTITTLNSGSSSYAIAYSTTTASV